MAKRVQKKKDDQQVNEAVAYLRSLIDGSMMTDEIDDVFIYITYLLNIALRKARGEKNKDAYVILKTFTPDVVRSLLATKAHNFRNADHVFMKKIQRDMENNRWQLNGETIKITQEGHLGDGLNRCTAARAAGVPFESFTALDLPSDFMMSVDSGRGRRLEDTIRNIGCAVSPKEAASVLRAWYRLEENGTYYHVRRHEKGSGLELTEFYLERRTLVEDVLKLVMLVHNKGDKAAGKVINYTILSVLLLEATRSMHVLPSHSLQAVEFCRRISQVGGGHDCPVVRVRQWFYDNKKRNEAAVGEFRKEFLRECRCRLVQAWNLFLADKRVARLPVWRGDEDKIVLATT